jgi:hypothetical protein
MRKMKKAFQISLGTIFGLIILFIVLKSAIKTVLQFDNYSSYSFIDERGQINTILIVPNNEIIFIKKYHEYYEMVLYYVTGTDAVHYFGPFYNVGETPLGIRVYPKAKEVWNADAELKDKEGNLSESTFPEIGKEYQMQIILYEKELSINGDVFKRDTISPDYIRAIRKEFK